MSRVTRPWLTAKNTLCKKKYNLSHLGKTMIKQTFSPTKKVKFSPRYRIFKLRMIVMQIIAMSSAATLMFPQHVSAADQYWDGVDTTSGNGAPIGGTGDWGTATNWTDDAAGTTNQAWTSGNNAIIGGVSSPINLTSDQTVGNMTFSVGGSLNTTNSSGIILANPDNIYSVGSGLFVTHFIDISGAGGITKAGTGRLNFIGAKSYTGATNINEGILRVQGATSLVNSAVIINDPGTLQVIVDSSVGSLAGDGEVQLVNAATVLTTGSDNSSTVFSGDIVSVGSFTDSGLTKVGTGTLALTGNNNSFVGVTTISAGTLNIGNGTLNGSVNGNIINNASLIYDRANSNLTYNSTISGTGNLTKEGSFTLTLGGANTYTGTTTINAGEIKVNGSLSNSTTTVNTSGTLSVNGTAGSVALSGGTANVNVGGTVGSVTLSSGTANVNGTAGSVALSGGTLKGTGTVGSVTLSGGTFAPGNSIGTIDVSGNVDFSAGGTYQVEVDAAGNSDLINATGSATLTNGVVNVVAAAGTYSSSTDYTILTAAGGLGGTTFNSVGVDLAFLDSSLSYDANNVYLTLMRNDVDFSSVASTPNQFAVASVITANQTPLVSIVSQVTPLSTSQAQSAFDSLSGVQHSVNPGIYNTLMQRFLQLIRVNRGGNGLATGLSSGDEVAKDIYWWGKGFTGNGDIDRDRDGTIAGMGYRNNGLTFGVDMSFNDHWRLGVAGSYANSDINGGGSDTDVDSYQLATYANWQQDDWYADMAIGYAKHDADSNRRVTVGVLTGIANADYDSDTMAASIEIGKRFQLQNKLNLTPFAGLEYSNTDRDSFTETGSFANLIVSSEKHESIRSKLGVKLDKVFKTAKGAQYMPSASLAYVHEHGEENNLMKAAFSAAPATSFRVEGNKQDRDRLQLDLGLTASINSRTQIDVSYVGEFANSDDYHSLNATVRVQW